MSVWLDSVQERKTYLIILWRELVEARLHNTIPIGVLDERHDVHTERDHDGKDLSVVPRIRLRISWVSFLRNLGAETAYLTRVREAINHLLHGSRPLHVQRDDEVVHDGLANRVSLLVRRAFKELLAEVIPERI